MHAPKYPSAQLAQLTFFGTLLEKENTASFVLFCFPNQQSCSRLSDSHGQPTAYGTGYLRCAHYAPCWVGQPQGKGGARCIVKTTKLKPLASSFTRSTGAITVLETVSGLPWGNRKKILINAIQTKKNVTNTSPHKCRLAYMTLKTDSGEGQKKVCPIEIVVIFKRI